MLSVNSLRPVRPVVEILIDSDGNRLKNPIRLDLEAEPLIYIAKPLAESWAIPLIFELPDSATIYAVGQAFFIFLKGFLVQYARFDEKSKRIVIGIEPNYRGMPIA